MNKSSQLTAVVLFLLALLMVVGAGCMIKLAQPEGPTIVLEKAPPQKGWNIDTGAIRYLDQEGKPLQEWNEINGKRYYFTPGTGNLVTGWQTIGDYQYYFDANGVMASSGDAVTGWQNLGGKFVLLDQDGRALIELRHADGKNYYYQYNSSPYSGWQVIDGKTFFMNEAGQAIMELRYDQGKACYHHLDGTPYSGWMMLEGKQYYFSEIGAITTGWETIDGKRYFFHTDGMPYVGWHTIDETLYYFSENGFVTTGWADVEGKNFYFDADGQTLSGWQLLDETYYYFTETGYTLSGWVELDGIRHRLNADGSPQSGWYTDTEGKHFLDNFGRPLVGWQTIDSRKYFFSEAGVVTTGWLTLEWDRYYFYPDGVMARGEVVIDGVSNFFSSSGKYVLLVNHKVPVPENYTLDLVNIEGYKVDRNAKPYLEAMIKAMRNLGYQCDINSIYRSITDQEKLWNNTYKDYIRQGYSHEKAVELTNLGTMTPGYSEHHTGLAVDLDCTAKGFAWLAEHCWEYGFILRYPDNKTEFTGIKYEPWHFRFVGVELAMELKDSGLCLEEYMMSLSSKED